MKLSCFSLSYTVRERKKERERGGGGGGGGERERELYINESTKVVSIRRRSGLYFVFELAL